MRVLKVAKHIYFDIALRDGGNCRESTHRLFEPITLSLIEEVLWYFVSASISISYESIYSCFERSGYFLSFCVASMNNIALTPWAPFFSQFSCSVVSDSLRPHGLHAACLAACPSPASGVYSNSCPLSWWCHPTISSSVIPFSSCLESFPASGSFQMSQFFTSGGQSTGVSASATVLPVNIQDWFPLGWTGWISLQSKGLSGVLSKTTVQKHKYFGAQLSLRSNSHIHTWLLEKP